MPKRKQRVSEYYRAKRSRTSRVEKIARSNQFINQLGGWTSNPGNRRSKDVIRPVTTTRLIASVTPQSSRGTLSFNMSTIPQSIRDVYQRIRLKKVTIFCVLTPVFSSGGTTNSVVQMSICKATQIDPDIDPRNVPGAQVKMFYMNFVGTDLPDNQGISDVIRCSRMYPPIEVDTSGTVGGAPQTKETYLSTANPSGMWTCFAYDFSGIPANKGLTLTYYFTAELLCNTMKG